MAISLGQIFVRSGYYNPKPNQPGHRVANPGPDSSYRNGNNEL